MEEDLRKLHGLLLALHDEQQQFGRTLEAELGGSSTEPSHKLLSLALQEGGFPTEDHPKGEDLHNKLNSLVNHLQGVESEGSRLRSDLSQFDQFLSSIPNEQAHVPQQIRQLEEEVRAMAAMQQDTEIHLAELGEVISVCLGALARHQDPAATTSREAELAMQVKELQDEQLRLSTVRAPSEDEMHLRAELEASQNALLAERDRVREFENVIASLRNQLDEGARTRAELEQKLSSMTTKSSEEIARLSAQQEQIEAELSETKALLGEEQKRASKAKKRYEQESKKNVKLFQELRTDMKEQCAQIATLESQTEELRTELLRERDAAQGLQRLADDQRVASEERERELLQSLRLAEEEIAALKQQVERADEKIIELQEQVNNLNEREHANLAREQQVDYEALYISSKEEFQRAKDEWSQEIQQRTARISVLAERVEQMEEELEQLKANLKDSQEATNLANDRAALIEQSLKSTAVQLLEKQAEVDRFRSEEAVVSTKLRALEEQMSTLEEVSLQRGRDEAATEFNRVQVSCDQLEEQVQTLKIERDSYKAEILAMQEELMQLRSKISSQRPASIEESCRRKLNLDALADLDTCDRQQRVSSKEQDMTDLLQSDDSIGLRRPRGDQLDPLQYLSEELALSIFARLSVRDLVSLSQVSQKYRRIASDPVLWKLRCTQIWNFNETDNYTGSDWREVYIYRLSRYKQVSCVIVGGAGSGKKTLLTAFEGMITRRGWNRGQEKDQCTVSVESLFEVPTMFNLNVLSADPLDLGRSLKTLLRDFLKEKRRPDVFIVCVPATSQSAYDRFEPVEKYILPVLEDLCPDIQRILVGTEADRRDDHRLSSATFALPYDFSRFEEKLHFSTTIFTSAMSNRGLVDLFDEAQKRVKTPVHLEQRKLRATATTPLFSVHKAEAAKKPARNNALAPRASTQLSPGGDLSSPLHTAPSSPRRQPVTPTTSTRSMTSRSAHTTTPFSSSSLYTPSSATPVGAHSAPPVSPYMYTPTMSESTPLPGDRRGSLASSSTTPTMRTPNRLSSSMSDRPRASPAPSERDRKCVLQ